MADLNVTTSESSALTESAPSPSYPIIKLIQTVSTGGVGITDVSTRVTTTTGNLLVYCAAVGGSSTCIETITDNGGNTWTQVAKATDGRASIWAASNAANITQFT